MTTDTKRYTFVAMAPLEWSFCYLYLWFSLVNNGDQGDVVKGRKDW